MKRTYTTTIVHEGSMCAIPVPFDPKQAFGKVRAPVKVTIRGYAYCSTIARMGGADWIPLRRSHREAAGVEGGEQVTVTLELDTSKRQVQPAADFVAAMKGDGAAWERWQELSYTHQREHHEHIEEAKKTETRERRIRKVVEALSTGEPKKRS